MSQAVISNNQSIKISTGGIFKATTNTNTTIFSTGYGEYAELIIIEAQGVAGIGGGGGGLLARINSTSIFDSGTLNGSSFIYQGEKKLLVPPSSSFSFVGNISSAGGSLTFTCVYQKFINSP